MTDIRVIISGSTDVSVSLTGTSSVIANVISGMPGPAGSGGGGGGGSFTAGGDLSGDETSQVVEKVHGTTYPAGGALTTGTIPRVTGVATVAYGALDLANAAAVTGLLPIANVATITTVNGVAMPAGGALAVGAVLRATAVGTAAYGAVDLADSDAVTGVLPDANQAAQSMGGDVAGTTAASTVTLAGDATGRVGTVVVAKVNGITYPSATLTAGQVPRATGTGTVAYGAVDLANASAVTGTLATANQAAQTLTGDVVGTTAANTCTLAGDVTGRTGTTVCARVNGTTYPAGGALTTGQVPRVTGAATVAYGALDLANTSAVTGTLPTGNQAAQTMTGDVTGTTAASVVAKVNGATYPAAGSLTTGTVPRVTGASAVAYGALDLANSSAVTGTLPTSNQASQTLAGDVTGTTAASTIVKITLGSDATGDLYYRSSGGVLVRLPAGTTGQALIQGASVPAWGSDFGAQNLVTTGAISLGAATVASQGSMRLPTTGSVWFRNNGNSADIAGFMKLASDSLAIGINGSLANPAANLLFGCASTVWFYAGGSTSATFGLSGTGCFSDALAVAKWAHTTRSSDTATTNMQFFAQGAFATATTNKSGAHVQVRGGARKDNTGKRGGWYAEMNGTTEFALEVCDVQAEGTSASRVFVIWRGSAITTTQMPTGTGDQVMYIGNAAVVPTVAPVSGAVVYANGGDIHCASSSGVIQALGNALTTRTWPSDANYTAVAADYSAAIIHLSGATLTATRNFVVPITAGYRWIIYNNTGGAQSIQVIGASGTGITIATGKRAEVYADGTNIVRLTADA